MPIKGADYYSPCYLRDTASLSISGWLVANQQQAAMVGPASPSTGVTATAASAAAGQRKFKSIGLLLLGITVLSATVASAGTATTLTHHQQQRRKLVQTTAAVRDRVLLAKRAFEG